MKKLLPITLIAAAAMLSGCDKDDDDMMNGGGGGSSAMDFTVTVENVFESKDYFNSGTTGLIMPGMSESFSFNAGIGHYMQFATMFVQSNDLFYAPADNGIALYDNNGVAITGDITAMIDLWDAGTEVNETPGSGPNQPPNQTGPNTGPDENGVVQPVANVMDGFTYPNTADAINVSVTHDGGTMFTVTISNTSDGTALPTPFAPGTWVVHFDGQNPMFMNGSAAGAGLEKLAEDGDNAMMDANLTSKSGLVSPYAPGAYSVGSSNEIFTVGQTASAALMALAEDGDPSGYTNVFNTPDGASAPGPIMPGASYSFSFNASNGDELSLALMLVQSNDWVLGANGISLFDNGTAISGDITGMIDLYDAGTEVDQYAGAGNDQAPRQSGANTGADENGNTEMEVNMGAHVPSIANMIKVTITAN